MSTPLSKALHVGVGGHAVAIDAATGAEIWRTKLESSSLVTVHESGSRLFAGAGGHLFCLDAASGEILRRNKLPGLGTGLVGFTSTSAESPAAVLQARAAAAGAANAASVQPIIAAD